MKNITIYLILLASYVSAQSPGSWLPRTPVPGDTIVIFADPSKHTGIPKTPDGDIKLHWGINGVPGAWTEPPESMWPSNTTAFGDRQAVRTVMKMDEHGLWSVSIATLPTVKNLLFGFVVNNTTWISNNGIDYNISFSTPDVRILPKNPTVNDTIRIIYSNHQNQSNMRLHWGVNADGDRWNRPVREYWPDNTYASFDSISVDTYMAGPDKNGNFSAKIGPFTSGRQLVKTVDFGFIWQGGYDFLDGVNYRIDLDYNRQPDWPYLDVLSPSDGEVLDKDVEITVQVERALGVRYYIQGELVADVTSPPFNLTVLAESLPLGEIIIVAVAYDEHGRVFLDGVDIWHTSEIVVAPAPQGAEFGTSVDAGNRVTFALPAPGKRFVSLTGDLGSHLMNRTEDGLWWLQIDAEPGIFKYRYRVDNEIEIADPAATDIEWKRADGSEDWSSPENAYAVLAVGQPDFCWSEMDSPYVLPEPSELIIYEAHVGDFAGLNRIGTFLDMLDRLDYLQKLGINAIELMPVNEFPGGDSWGYNPVFYAAPESQYGTPDDFKKLVDGAHKRGIAVILDVVFNHSEGKCPLYRLYASEPANNPWYHDYHAPFDWADWGPEFDHDSEFTQRFFDFVLKTWIEEFHVDGFRLDVSWGLADPFGTGPQEALHRQETIGRLVQKAKEIKPDIFIVAEHSPPDVGEEPAIVRNTPLDAMWHFNFHWRFKEVLKPSYNLSDVARVLDYDGFTYYNGWRFTSSDQVVNYTTSHDEQRTIYEFTRYQDGDEATGIELEKATGAALLTAAGIPMLYHGQEFGEKTAKIVGRNPLHWNLLEDPRHRDIYNFYARLIWLRKTWKVLQGDEFETLRVRGNTSIIYQRADENEKIVVAINFHRSVDDRVSIRFPDAGTWYEFTTDDSVTVPDNKTLYCDLPSATALIFTNRRNWQDLDIPTELGIRIDENSAVEDEFCLYSNYPNPFNASTTIQYWMAGPAEARVEIFNIKGQRIRILVQDRQEAGLHRVVWDGRSDAKQTLASGIYFCRFWAGDFNGTRKLLLMR